MMLKGLTIDAVMKNVQCVRETEILGEQQPPQGFLVCDHAGLVINKFSLAATLGMMLKGLTIDAVMIGGPAANSNQVPAQPLHRNVQWCRGGLVFEAHRLLYHSA